MQPRANSLFHFTKSIDFLQKILGNGFYPRYCPEDSSLIKCDEIAHPMVCFCDIPISRISEHTRFYGEYGIGLSKDWAIRNNLHPVIYSHETGPVAELMNFILDEPLNCDHCNEEHKPTSLEVFFDKLFPFLKPLAGTMRVYGELKQKEFYQENEWRYVPNKFEMLIGEEDIKNRTNDMNVLQESEPLTFKPEDIKYIFVKNDTEIPIIFDFINESLKVSNPNDAKILSTKIVSLETLISDV
ncbi:abortive infection system antitoxin AbiGi family protein [uncultured Tolumonas sp.]|uniref:abortive infection system antitoxin AbiGi family protein n=1 Tax=uncultured Tolumonas sp. TaxID=263765 RepID=UPI0029313281|nr:abortive infection system antitoxin AbiGi family protein [uncultured Tolumonas sp.]